MNAESSVWKLAISSGSCRAHAAAYSLNIRAVAVGLIDSVMRNMVGAAVSEVDYVRGNDLNA
ncbi:hypothetical protein GCM10023321_84440 [Pseudonocardia eucalypti]|uniref:Uncharacterized protein n=1 Tax=Pseudonocardia eucalypti TaxID=648755 RepID=A0ABP9RES4_9PSEU